MRSRAPAPFALALALAAGPAGATTVGPVLELSVGPATAAQRAPALAFDPSGGTYLMVWEDERAPLNGVDLYAIRLDASGQPLLGDGAGCPVLAAPQAAGNEIQPAVVAVPSAGDALIAWTEARTGTNDIYAARWRLATCTVEPSVPVAATANEEQVPAISAGVSRAIVAYQQGVGGGGQVLARRFGLDLSVADPAAGVVSGAGAARPEIVARGAAHAVVWDRGGVVELRRVSETGALTSGLTTAASAGTGATRADVGAFGPGSMVVWQDASAGVGAEDVFGRRFDAAGLPAGAAGALSAAPMGQIDPRIAGDDTRALVVWPDRRNGVTVAIVYGTRLDGVTGAPLDGDGVPLLPLTGNAFEVALAKGPGADYLVAAVRFGSPNRIFYRVVRDEPPAGTMTAAEPPAALADGVTGAVLDFGPAVGASGLPVVDGTLYTVTHSPTTATVTTPDQDPNRAGHQVAAGNGRVRVSVAYGAPGAVTTTIVSTEGAATGQGLTRYLNAPPTANQVTVSPPNPTAAQDLLLTYVYADGNGDPEQGTQIRWLRNAAVQAGLADQATVPASATRRGDAWRAQVTPSDGGSFGPAVFSNTITVRNAPPEARDVRISPDALVRSGTPLTGLYTYADADGDPEGATALRWYADDLEQADLRDRDRVPSGRVQRGEAWRFEVTPEDGTELGRTVTSSAVTIINTAPNAFAGEDGEVVEGERYVLDGRGSADRDPQDTLRYDWRQVAGEVQVDLTDTASATPSFVAPDVFGDRVVTFQLTVSDGELESGASRVRVTIRSRPDGDADGLDDAVEVAMGTNPDDPDTDNDGLADGAEVQLGADPLDADSDDDGIADGREGRTCPACNDVDPGADPDRDGLGFVLDPDGDDDGLFDGTELSRTDAVPSGGAAPFAYVGTDLAAGRFAPDADPDTATDPTVADSDLDGLTDGQEDANANGRLDPGESDPNDPRDPGVACDEATPCPAGGICIDGLCVPAGGGPDGGTDCALPPRTECCQGGCAAGPVVESVCAPGQAVASCPAEAELCRAGACTGPAPNPLPAEGCACDATGGAAPGAGLGLLLLVLLRRRRR